MTAQSNPPTKPSKHIQVGVRIPRWIRTALSALSFWIAITLPILYIPLLIVGPETTGSAVLFPSLLGLHVLTLFGGRNHKRGNA